MRLFLVQRKRWSISKSFPTQITMIWASRSCMNIWMLLEQKKMSWENIASHRSGTVPWVELSRKILYRRQRIWNGLSHQVCATFYVGSMPSDLAKPCRIWDMFVDLEHVAWYYEFNGWSFLRLQSTEKETYFRWALIESLFLYLNEEK